jgi:hypothetical protein
LLDVVTVDGAAREHHLEAVVVLRVVAARDLDAAGAAVVGARRGDVVKHRRGDGAEVDDVEAGRGQAADQRVDQHRARHAPVAPDRDRALAGGHGRAAEGAAKVVGKGGIDAGTDDTTDVIGFETRGVDVHGRSQGWGAAIVGTAWSRLPRADASVPGRAPPATIAKT